MILRQSWALLVDAYRELNARKLFWVTMGLTLLVVGVFAALGISEGGVTFLHWEFPNTDYASTVISEAVFYKTVFSTLGIAIWLTWIAMVLALISTAGMIPDLVSSGGIETVLSKPVGRVRLLLTKYAMCLLFVFAQVLVFCIGSFLVFGLRAGVWEPRLFLAVPIVVLFYSYLACVCCFVGLITRSTITALLLTLLFWFVLFLVNVTDIGLMSLRVQMEMTQDREQRRLERMIENTDTLLAEQREAEGLSLDGWSPSEEERTAMNQFLPINRERIEEKAKDLETVRFLSRVAFGVKTALPKTGETAALLERSLIDLSDLPGFEESPSDSPYGLDDTAIRVSNEAVERELVGRLRERPLWWIVGTSLGFQAVVLLLCCWIFARRDF